MKPRPSRYNDAILKILVLFLKTFELFTFKTRTQQRKNIFAVWEVLLKLDGSCGVREQAAASSLPPTSQRSPLSTSGHTTSLWGKVGAFPF